MSRVVLGQVVCLPCARRIDGDGTCQEDWHDDEDDDDDGSLDCGLCMGTGIGQHGDPDTSRCVSCGGSGVRRG